MADKKYAFTKLFELSVVLAEISRPRFHDLIGHALSPGLMPTRSAELLVMAAHAITEEQNTIGCPSSIVAMQYLRTLSDRGKISFDDILKCDDFIELAEDLADIDDLDSVIKTLTPILIRTKQKDLVTSSIDDYGKGRDIRETAEEWSKVASLGKKRSSLGQGLLADVADVQNALKNKLENPLPTGIYELDMILGGGLEKQAIGMVCGPTGTGKSMFLCHVAVESLIIGYDVAYMTLELSEETIKKRIYSNLCEMTDLEMVDNSQLVVDRLQTWLEEGIGGFRVKYETGGATTPGHLDTWLRDLEREEKFKPRVIIVDMADHLIARLNAETYGDQKNVYQQFRNIVVERDGWGWTASHAKAAAETRSKIRTNMVADSMNKVRICDLQVGLARTTEDEENNMVRFNIGKRREGEDHSAIGPLARDMEHGRIVTVSDRINPWIPSRGKKFGNWAGDNGQA